MDAGRNPYVVEEVFLNLRDLPPSASAQWARLRPEILILDDVLSLDRPVVFEHSKDRPILFSALAWADILLTLDQAHFGGFMATPFYDLVVLRPGVLLERQRAAGILR